MDLWTFNKLAAAVLASLLVIIGTNTAVEVLYPTGGPGEYTVVEVEQEQETQTADMTGAQTGEEEAAETVQPLPVRLAAADPEAGQKVSRECSACHVFEEGGPNRVGPALYGIVGDKVASAEGFAYSNALKEYGGEWTYERLDCFLENPSACVEGTSMGYAGIKDPSKRADMIAYLASRGDAPPFPEADTATQDAPAASAEDTQAASAEAETAEPADTEDQAVETAPEATPEPAAKETATRAEAGNGPEAEAKPAQTQQASDEQSTPTAAATGDPSASDGKAKPDQADASEAGPRNTQLAELLAAGDPAEGEKAVRVCSACHVFNEGGPNRVGPNLYGVVGRDVASIDGFNYSQALKDYGGAWTYERLDCYLENPRECVPGNKMTYAGVKDDGKRADIIAYLASLGEAPSLPGGEQDTGEAEQSEDAANAGKAEHKEARAATLADDQPRTR